MEAKLVFTYSSYCEDLNTVQADISKFFCNIIDDKCFFYCLVAHSSHCTSSDKYNGMLRITPELLQHRKARSQIVQFSPEIDPNCDVINTRSIFIKCSGVHSTGFTLNRPLVLLGFLLHSVAKYRWRPNKKDLSSKRGAPMKEHGALDLCHFAYYGKSDSGCPKCPNQHFKFFHWPVTSGSKNFITGMS